ncbi:MAG TPA: hypothetical protein VHE37_11895, partial [Nevskiaceae bacterium]|nr:hypothetical protein [Nevskiaceae bacterium]
LGRIAYAGMQWTEAVAHLRSAVQLAPRNAGYHNQLGDALAKYIDDVTVFRKPTVARQLRDEYIRAIELDPEMLDARESLLQFYVRAPGFVGGDLDKAREQAREIARRDAARGYKAYGDVDAADDRFDAAAREYRQALQLNPKYADAREALDKLGERGSSRKPTHI